MVDQSTIAISANADKAGKEGNAPAPANTEQNIKEKQNEELSAQEKEQQQQVQEDFLNILRRASKVNASDIFFVAGRSLAFKVGTDIISYEELIRRLEPLGELETPLPEKTPAGSAPATGGRNKGPIEYRKLLPDDTEPFIREMYRLAGRDIHPFLESKDDDFSFTIRGLSRFRVNTYNQRTSMAAVVRLIVFSLPDPKELHIPDCVMNVANRKKGLVLATGPAGSPKSTTMACIIDRINHSRSGHIITLEDPLEFLHSHDKCIISQREINTDTKSYLSSLRAALRESPDVILLGEMRDQETIQTALTAAETGHLVFSSLHTLGAVNSINRILDVFPPNQQQQIAVQLSMVLKDVISQQLVEGVNKEMIPIFEVLEIESATRNNIRERKVHLISSNSGFKMMMNNELKRLLEEGKITQETYNETISSSKSDINNPPPAPRRPLPPTKAKKGGLFARLRASLQKKPAEKPPQKLEEKPAAEMPEAETAEDTVVNVESIAEKPESIPEKAESTAEIDKPAPKKNPQPSKGKAKGKGKHRR